MKIVIRDMLMEDPIYVGAAFREVAQADLDATEDRVEFPDEPNPHTVVVNGQNCLLE